MNIVDLKDEPGLLQTLAEWHHLEWSYLNPQTDFQMRLIEMQSYLDDELVPSTFIAKEENILLGSAAIVSHDMDILPDLSPWLASVFVASEHRRKGVASQLVKHIENKAKTENIASLYLYTPDREDFYLKLGWIVMEHKSYRGHNVSIMTKQLQN